MKIRINKTFNKLWRLFPYIKYRLYLLRLKKYNFKNKKVVLFFLPPELNIRSGGILAIYFMMDETKKMLGESIVLPVTLSRLPKYKKLEWFINDWFVYNIYYLQANLLEADKILINVPEAFYSDFCSLLKSFNLLNLAEKFKVNIMNLNDNYLPSPIFLANSKRMFNSLTMTLAFEANKGKSNSYSFLDSKPYFISTWFYNYTIDEIPFDRKENICIISPDSNQYKDEIVDLLESEFGLDCIEIKNMAFHDFQILQQRAKWSVSFGEGFDNYFAGAFLKSGIGLSVYDPVFFPHNFVKENLPDTVFDTYDFMKNNIIQVMKRLDSKFEYEGYIAKVKPLILEHSSPEKVVGYLKEYYRSELGSL